MQLLKLFLMLIFLPLLAAEDTEKCLDAPAKSRSNTTLEMSQKDSLKPDEKPLEMTAPTQKPLMFIKQPSPMRQLLSRPLWS